MTIILPEEIVVGGVTYITGDNLTVGDPIHLNIVTVAAPTGNSTYYLYRQDEPLATWTINHSFNRYPNVTIIGSDNFAIITDIEYPNTSMVVLTFSQPTTGKALLT